MRKINILFYIIGILCFIIAGYIIYDEFFGVYKEEIVFYEEEELETLNNKLKEIGSPLGWIVIVDGISNQDRNGNYNISFNKNLFDDYGYRQLFVMEYILSNEDNYDLFTVLDMNGNKTDDMPTSDFTKAYLKYDKYNEYYKDLFGEDFDISKAVKGNTKYDKTHVYYENRRAGSNGVYVSMIQASSVNYEDDIYKAEVKVTYSTRASELVGIEDDIAIIEYTKNINDDIKIKSFVVKGR